METVGRPHAESLDSFFRPGPSTDHFICPGDPHKGPPLASETNAGLRPPRPYQILRPPHQTGFGGCPPSPPLARVFGGVTHPSLGSLKGSRLGGFTTNDEETP
jgi:hypothetical protein